MGEIRSTNVDGERSEYRFVYSRAEIRRRAFPFGIPLMAMLAFFPYSYFFYPAHREEANFILFIFTIVFFVSVAQLIQIFRISITIDQEGIVCNGYGFIEMPYRCGWNEFSHVCVAAQTKGTRRWLVFIRRYGEYLLLVSDFGKHFYVGVGHSLTIEEAVERFMGPLLELSEAEKEKIRGWQHRPLLIGAKKSE